MKYSELTAKSPEELQAELVSLRKSQFSLRMQKTTGQETKGHVVRQTRRDIARVKTAINAKV